MTDRKTTADSRNFSAVALRLYSHLVRRQISEAIGLINRYLLRLAPEQVHMEIILPAIGLAGSKLSLNEITEETAQAVFAYFDQLLKLCRAQMNRQPPLGLEMHAVSLPGELHGGGLKVICDWLWRDGWDTHLDHCGTNEGVLAAHLLETPHHMVAISCSTPRQATAARRLIRHLRRGSFAGSIWIGGMAINAFPKLFERSGADHTAPDIVRFSRELATEFGYLTATPPYL